MLQSKTLLGRKAVTNLDSILKSRDITLPTKVCLVKAMVFSVVMYGCESWTLKKAECWRTDAFELWCWRRLLKVPWTAKRSNQSVLKEISPEYSLEGHPEAEAPRLWPPDVKNRLIGKDPDAGKDWRQEEKGITEDEMVGWHHQLNGHVWASFGSWWWTGKPDMLQSMGSQSVWLDWVTELRPSLSWWCIFRHSETALYWVLSACLPTYCVGAFPFLRLCCL